MITAHATYNTGMNPALSSTMYLLLATVLSAAGSTFAAHIPIMNDLYLEQNNRILEPVYSKFDRARTENNHIDLDDDNTMGDQVQVDIKPPHIQRVVAGGRVEIVCEANGSPPPKIQWFKGHELVQESGFEEQNDLGAMSLASVKSRLLIDCVRPEHQGVYTCQAVAGSQSKMSKHVTIFVQGGDNKTCLDRQHKPVMAPRIITWSPVTIATIGGDIAIPCTAAGYPQPEIFWTNQENENVANDPRVQVLKTGELFISKLHWQDMGEYTCVAISPMGRTQESTFLYPLSEED
ncbi:hypothetical protein WDU94_001051 [Cyamophila willieti]